MLFFYYPRLIPSLEALDAIHETEFDARGAVVLKPAFTTEVVVMSDVGEEVTLARRLVEEDATRADYELIPLAADDLGLLAHASVEGTLHLVLGIGIDVA